VFTVIVLIGALLLVTAAVRLARLVRRTPKPAQEGQVSDTTPTQTDPTSAPPSTAMRSVNAGARQRTSDRDVIGV
jgi:hypothetical protein